MADRWGAMETVTDFIFLGSKITADGDYSHEIKRRSLLGRESSNLDDQPRQHVKKQRHYFADKGPSSQSYGFSSSHVWMCELDHKESWGPKNWCFLTVVLEKTIESPLESKEIKLVNPKGNRHQIITGRTDAVAETLWPPDVKNWFIKKTLILGKMEGRRRRGRRRMRCMDGITDLMDTSLSKLWEFGDGQGSLTYGNAKSWTQLSNWTDNIYVYTMCVCVCVYVRVCIHTHHIFSLSIHLLRNT